MRKRKQENSKNIYKFEKEWKRFSRCFWYFSHKKPKK